VSALRRLLPLCDDADFLEFWELSTRKVDKKRSKEEYMKARMRASKQTIHESYARYGLETAHRNIEHIAHPSTWLRNDLWENEYDSDRKVTQLSDQRIAAARAALARAALGRG
jgi:hypothetical protein